MKFDIVIQKSFAIVQNLGIRTVEEMWYTDKDRKYYHEINILLSIITVTDKNY